MRLLAELSFFNGRLAITELIWTLIGFVGLFINYANYADAKYDLYLLDTLGRNGWMRRIAKSHRDSNRNRSWVNVCVITAGVVSMSQKAANPRTPVTPTGITVTVLLFAIVLISIINPIQERKLRHDLMKSGEHNE